MDKLHLASGVSAVVMNYFTHMDATRYVFDFMLHEEPPLPLREEVARHGGRVYVMPALKGRNLLRYTRALHRFFREHPEYRIVHGHIANAAVFYLGAARRCGVPYRLLHSHNSQAADHPFKKIRNRILAAPAKLVSNRWLACSGAAGGFLFGAKNTSRVRIIYNAVDLERFLFSSKTREKVRRELGLSGTFVVGHAGRMCAQKNQAFLLRIFTEILRLEPSARLLLAGDGETRAYLEERADALGIMGQTIFLGVRDDIPALMQAMDLFLLPSLFEGLPLVGVEAQVAGLPCLFADTVTRETEIGKNVRFLSLRDAPEVWARAALAYREDVDRSIDVKAFAAFDLRGQAGALAQYYDTLQ